MFFSLILENAAGDQIDMTATANQYMTSQIEGLLPPPGTISTSDLNILPDTIDLRCLIQTYAPFGIALQNFLFTTHLYLLPQVMTSDIDCVY